MNLCSNDKCKKELYKHNLFCYECGYKSTNPIINNIVRPVLKRTTHIYCHSCFKCVETYDDKKCRNCGIKLLSYIDIDDMFSHFNDENKKKEIKLKESTEIKNVKEKIVTNIQENK